MKLVAKAEERKNRLAAQKTGGGPPAAELSHLTATVINTVPQLILPPPANIFDSDGDGNR